MEIIAGFLLCVVLYILVPKSCNKIAAFTVAFVMSYMAYHLSEKNQYDLIAHRQLLEDLIHGGYENALIYSSVNSSPLYIWFQYFISLFKQVNLASAIPTFIGYFLLLFVLGKMSIKEKINKNKQVVIFSSLIFILPWQDYAAGVRGALAFSICLFAIYLDFEKNKKIISLLFFVSSIYIHQAAIILCFLRLFLLLVQKNILNYRLVCVCCLLMGSMTLFLGPLLESVANLTGLPIFQIISKSFNSYVVDGTDIYEYTVVGLRVFSIILVYYIVRNSLSLEERNQSLSFKLYTLLMLTTIGYIWQYDIVCRYSFVCIILSSLLLCLCNQKYLVLLMVFSIFNLFIYSNIYYFKWDLL